MTDAELRDEAIHLMDRRAREVVARGVEVRERAHVTVHEEAGGGIFGRALWGRRFLAVRLELCAGVGQSAAGQKGFAV